MFPRRSMGTSFCCETIDYLVPMLPRGNGTSLLLIHYFAGFCGRGWDLPGDAIALTDDPALHGYGSRGSLFHHGLTAAAVASAASGTIVAAATVAAAPAVPAAGVVSAAVAGIAKVGGIAVKIAPVTLPAAAAAPTIVREHGEKHSQRPAVSLVCDRSSDGNRSSMNRTTWTEDRKQDSRNPHCSSRCSLNSLLATTNYVRRCMSYCIRSHSRSHSRHYRSRGLNFAHQPWRLPPDKKGRKSSQQKKRFHRVCSLLLQAQTGHPKRVRLDLH